jgi:predicted RNase H-like HicB family nuclease
MRIRGIVHNSEVGCGFWAEVPSIPGCATQGETMEEIEAKVRETIEGCLSVEVEKPVLQLDDQVIELAL